MTHRLNQVLTFTNVPGGAIVAQPHQINVYDVPLVPDIVFRDNGDFTIISCTTTTLTVQNTSLAAATLNAWLWRQHTFDREYGGSGTTSLSPQPFIPAASGSGGGGGNSVIIEEGGVPLPGNPFTTFNFVGPGVQATDAGGGVVQVDVPGSPELFVVANPGPAPFIEGMPIYSALQPADASLLSKSQVIGLSLTATPPGFPAIICAGGEVTLTTAQWDAVTGMVGGLVPLSRYFLDDAAPGKLTVLAPTAIGSSSVLIGRAVTTQLMVVEIADGIFL